MVARHVPNINDCNHLYPADDLLNRLAGLFRLSSHGIKVVFELTPTTPRVPCVISAGTCFLQVPEQQLPSVTHSMCDELRGIATRARGPAGPTCASKSKP